MLNCFNIITSLSIISGHEKLGVKLLLKKSDFPNVRKISIVSNSSVACVLASKKKKRQWQNYHLPNLNGFIISFVNKQRL